LKLSPRKYHRKTLNLNNAMLTDKKLIALGPLIAKFHTVQLGGKQEFTKEGFQNLCKSWVIRPDTEEQENGGFLGSKIKNIFNPISSCDNGLLLKRLELKSNRQQNLNLSPEQIYKDRDERCGKKIKKKILDLSWVAEEMEDSKKVDERYGLLKELATLIPCLHELVLDGFLKVEIKVEIPGIFDNDDIAILWQKLSEEYHMKLLSLRDCSMTDRRLLQEGCCEGLVNIEVVDLSQNNDITHEGWVKLVQAIRAKEEGGNHIRLKKLIFQNGKIREKCGEQFSSMFQYIEEFDLQGCTLMDPSFLEGLDDEDSRVKKFNISYCKIPEDKAIPKVGSNVLQCTKTSQISSHAACSTCCTSNCCDIQE